MELYLVVFFLSFCVLLIFPACWHSGAIDKIQYMCKRNGQVGLYSASWSCPERKDTVVCPTPSTWRRPNHEEPRRSDTFRSGNGKSLWQLWLLFTRMSGLAQCPPGSSFGRVGVLPENLSRSHLCPRFLCTSVSSAPLAKSKYQFPCLVVFKKKNHKMLGA